MNDLCLIAEKQISKNFLIISDMTVRSFHSTKIEGNKYPMNKPKPCFPLASNENPMYLLSGGVVPIIHQMLSSEFFISSK